LLHLQNGDSVLKKISAENGRLNALAKEKTQDNILIEELFLATLGRHPSTAEIATVRKNVSSAGHDETLVDLFWALLNSKEFAFNH